MSVIYTESDDTRAAIFISNLILARASEQGSMDDTREQEFVDMVDIFILPAVRIVRQWSTIEPSAGSQRSLVRDTIVIIGQAIDMYSTRALALLPPQMVAQARSQVADKIGRRV